MKKDRSTYQSMSLNEIPCRYYKMILWSIPCCCWCLKPPALIHPTHFSLCILFYCGWSKSNRNTCICLCWLPHYRSIGILKHEESLCKSLHQLYHLIWHGFYNYPFEIMNNSCHQYHHYRYKPCIGPAARSYFSFLQGTM